MILFDCIPSVKFCVFCMKVLGSALGLTWPLFPNLKMLEIDLHDLSGWTCFSRLLHTVPNLKVLILGLVCKSLVTNIFIFL